MRSSLGWSGSPAPYKKSGAASDVSQRRSFRNRARDQAGALLRVPVLLDEMTQRNKIRQAYSVTVAHNEDNVQIVVLDKNMMRICFSHKARGFHGVCDVVEFKAERFATNKNLVCDKIDIFSDPQQGVADDARQSEFIAAMEAMSLALASGKAEPSYAIIMNV